MSREAFAAEETNSSAAEAAAAHGPKLFFPHHTPILLGAQSLAPPWSVGVKVLGSQLRLVGAAGHADLWGDGMGTSKQKGYLPPELFPPPSFWGCCSVNTDDNTEAKPVVSSVSLQLSLLSPRGTWGAHHRPLPGAGSAHRPHHQPAL